MNNERAKRQLNSNAKNVDEQCEDLHENCGRWASRDYCQNDDFKRFMSMKCRRSCKLCGEGKWYCFKYIDILEDDGYK